MKYKITLWRNSDYCKVANDFDHCAFSKIIEADSEYLAAKEAIRPHKGSHYKDKPSVYKIEVVE